MIEQKKICVLPNILSQHLEIQNAQQKNFKIIFNKQLSTNNLREEIASMIQDEFSDSNDSLDITDNSAIDKNGVINDYEFINQLKSNRDDSNVLKILQQMTQININDNDDDGNVDGNDNVNDNDNDHDLYDDSSSVDLIDNDTGFGRRSSGSGFKRWKPVRKHHSCKFVKEKNNALQGLTGKYNT
eukprot:Pgem_evm1s2905